MAKNKSKKEEFRELVDEFSQKPEERLVVGRCGECESVVWIDTEQRKSGMAKNCEEHEPLCHLV